MERVAAVLAPATVQNTLTIDRLKAYYINEHYGIKREIRAVDDISLTVRKNEIYTCGDHVCQISEQCSAAKGSGCEADCGRCPDPEQ